jgi:type II secretory ATPase GspE/PulE/Tfp pilus assembly ATPase PilB-like protein
VGWFPVSREPKAIDVLRERAGGGGVEPIRPGLIVFSGPPGCVKSTTIYSILNEFDPSQNNIQTAELPIEVVMPHVNKVEISDYGRNIFLNWVRGIVREAPDIYA